MVIKNDTKTFLGFIDDPINKKKNKLNNNEVEENEEDEEDDYPYSTKIGGSPIWCAQPPNYLKDIKCNTCNSNMAFLLQAYCPLNTLPDYERNYYIFICPNGNCNQLSSGWKVIKCLDPLKEEEEEILEEQDNSNTTTTIIEDKPVDDWGIEDTDEWGITNTTTTTTTTTTTITNSIDQLLKIRDDAIKEEKKRIKEEQLLSKNKNNEDCIQVEEEIISGIIIPDDKSNQYQPCNLFIDEESLYVTKKEKINKNNNNDDDLNQNIMKKYQGLENEFGDDGGEWSNETYEYVKDRIFNKFIKKISLAPDQCLRYSYGGKPLPMTTDGVKQLTFNNDNNPAPKCSICQSIKIFEFQILSTLISQIKLRDSKNQNQLEFGNTFIYSCPNNCFDKQKDTFNNVIYTLETIKVEKSI